MLFQAKKDTNNTCLKPIFPKMLVGSTCCMSTSDNKHEKYPKNIDGNFFAVMVFC